MKKFLAIFVALMVVFAAGAAVAGPGSYADSGTNFSTGSNYDANGRFFTMGDADLKIQITPLTDLPQSSTEHSADQRSPGTDLDIRHKQVQAGKHQPHDHKWQNLEKRQKGFTHIVVFEQSLHKLLALDRTCHRNSNDHEDWTDCDDREIIGEASQQWTGFFDPPDPVKCFLDV